MKEAEQYADYLAEALANVVLGRVGDQVIMDPTLYAASQIRQYLFWKNRHNPFDETITLTHEQTIEKVATQSEVH